MFCWFLTYKDANQNIYIYIYIEREHGNPLYYVYLENPMKKVHRGGWWAIIHRAAKSWI